MSNNESRKGSDSTTWAKQASRKSNELIYKISSKSVGFIVFSEAFYSNGWKSFINEKPIEHHKVNYLLRGMEVPQGEYTIRFEFGSPIFHIK